jgi:hypothetical protein
MISFLTLKWVQWIRQVWTIFFWIRLGNKCFWLCGQCICCSNHCTLLKAATDSKQTNGCDWLCANKTSLIKTGIRLDLAHRLQFATPRTRWCRSFFYCWYFRIQLVLIAVLYFPKKYYSIIYWIIQPSVDYAVCGVLKYSSAPFFSFLPYWMCMMYIADLSYCN